MLITAEQLITFSLIFSRMIAMILMAPGFSGKDIFSMGKVVFVFWLSALLIFYIPLPLQFPNTPLLIFFALIIEILIGTLLGFIAQLIVTGMEFAGSLMDTQAGLSVASMLDPSSGQTTTIISKVVRQLGLLVFLIINGHHVIFGTLIQSFSAVPIGSVFDLSRAAQSAIKSGVYIFEIAVQLAAPILLVVFLVDFGFGMLSRVAPQVNVFEMGFKIKPLVSIEVKFT